MDLCRFSISLECCCRSSLDWINLGRMEFAMGMACCRNCSRRDLSGICRLECEKAKRDCFSSGWILVKARSLSLVSVARCDSFGSWLSSRMNLGNWFAWRRDCLIQSICSRLNLG